MKNLACLLPLLVLSCGRSETEPLPETDSGVDVVELAPAVDGGQDLVELAPAIDGGQDLVELAPAIDGGQACGEGWEQLHYIGWPNVICSPTDSAGPSPCPPGAHLRWLGDGLVECLQ
jgi:hypothetical protein